MTNNQKLEIKNRMQEMMERTRKQKLELQKEIEEKSQKFQDAKDESVKNQNNNSNIFSQLAGLELLIKILDEIRKEERLRSLKEALEKAFELNQKEALTYSMNKQIEERLEIISKAETNGLKDFLKENDVYSVFEKGKLEDYIENKNSSNNENLNDNNSNSENKNTQEKDLKENKENKENKEREITDKKEKKEKEVSNETRER